MHFNLISKRSLTLFFISGVLLTTLAPAVCSADEEDTENYQAKFQFTNVSQYHRAFGEKRPAGLDGSKYSGSFPVYSLTNNSDRSWTRTLTGYFGVRPWDGGELYLNPEITEGVPFTNSLIGMGGFYNGEITRAAGTNPKLYRQRLFMRQTWNFDGEDQKIESDLNWMAGTVSKNRVVLTVGNFALLDVFDKNAYSNDPRRQFMNWGNMNNVAYDYAADARGFGWGFTTEWYQDEWVVRFGRMTGPKEPNALPVDHQILKHYGDQLEVEHDHEINEQPGAVRVIAYRNRAKLASFRDAINYGDSVGWTPDATNGMEYILNVRGAEKIKYGFGINIDQALSSNLGVFFKAMWADGRTETYAFGEVDRSIATGVAIKGGSWSRAQDTLGISYLAHFLSKDRREYLEKGGISFFIGDGWLNYRPEQVFETYYNLNLNKYLWLTADVQRIWNPAYNADRGPVNIFGARIHAEF
jgi:hypothetical protein